MHINHLPGGNPKQGIENVLVGKVKLVFELFKNPPYVRGMCALFVDIALFHFVILMLIKFFGIRFPSANIVSA